MSLSANSSWFTLFRLPEVILLILGATGAFRLIHQMNYNVMHAPKVYSFERINSIAIANNTDFSYPVRLQGHVCWPAQLLTCMHARNDTKLTTNVVRRSAHLTACCEQLFSPSSTPQQVCSEGVPQQHFLEMR